MGKLFYFVLLIIVVRENVHGQTVRRQLLSAQAMRFHQTLYAYGYEQSGSNLIFKCLSYTQKLEPKDSVSISLGKHSVSDFLEITVDTMHDVLSFYFQLSNQKNEAALLRVNDSLRTMGFTEKYDANHIQTFSIFENEKYYFKDFLFTIRSSKDSANQQFYLSGYRVKNLAKPFEYDFVWQLPFERQNIHNAFILYADTNQIWVYAHLNDGLKKGQWILRVNAKTGELNKGTKLNPRNNVRNFLVSAIQPNQKDKTMDLMGSIYDAKTINFKNNTYDFTNQSKNHNIFLIKMDSTGDVISRTEMPFPLPVQTKTGNHLQSFHLKIRKFRKDANGRYEVWSDIYEQSTPLVFQYYSSWAFTLVPNDVDYTVERSQFFIASQTVPNFTSLKKGDAFGNYTLKNIGEYDRMKIKHPLNDVVIHGERNSDNNPVMVLKKTDLSISKRIFYQISFNGKKATSKSILEEQQGQHANLFFTGITTYVSFLTNIANSEFELTLNSL